MLRKGLTILLTHSGHRKQTVSCNQIARALNGRSCENSSCLNSANSLHIAGYTTVNYQIVYPGKVSPGCFVPSHIERPSYASVSRLSRIVHNSWLFNKLSIEVKSEEQIRGMRDACRYDCCCCYTCVLSCNVHNAIHMQYVVCSTAIMGNLINE